MSSEHSRYFWAGLRRLKQEKFFPDNKPNLISEHNTHDTTSIATPTGDKSQSMHICQQIKMPSNTNDENEDTNALGSLTKPLSSLNIESDQPVSEESQGQKEINTLQVLFPPPLL